MLTSKVSEVKVVDMTENTEDHKMDLPSPDMLARWTKYVAEADDITLMWWLDKYIWMDKYTLSDEEFRSIVTAEWDRRYRA